MWCCCCYFFFFFFKQKTAYEMRISDWSSDVCSSDLVWADRSFDADATDWGLRSWCDGGRRYRCRRLWRCDVLRGRRRGREGDRRNGEDEFHWRDSGAGCEGAAGLGSRGEPSGRLTEAESGRAHV